MIFVTIGSMFPFDRLIRLMDRWAAATSRDDLLAQIGDGTYVPEHMRWTRRLAKSEFTETVRGASAVVSHAGMGTVITAGGIGTPLVLLPRIMSLGEHTTDHQLATARWLREKPGIFIVAGDAELPAAIAAAEACPKATETLPPYAPTYFTDRLNRQITEFLNE